MGACMCVCVYEGKKNMRCWRHANLELICVKHVDENRRRVMKRDEKGAESRCVCTVTETEHS